MKSRDKKMFVIALILIVFGGLLIGNAGRFDSSESEKLTLFGMKATIANPFTSNGEVIEETKTFTVEETESIEDIDIRWSAGTIEVKEWDKDYVEVQYSYNDDVSSPSFTIKNKKLEIRSETENTITIGIVLNTEIKATLYVPKKMMVKELAVKLNAGEMVINSEFEVTNETEICLNAGELTIDNLTSKKETSIKVNAGDLEMSNINCENDTEVDVNAGEVNIEGHIANELEIEVKAGSLTVKNDVSISDTSIEAEVNAGSARINNTKISGMSEEYKDRKSGVSNALKVEVNAGDLVVDYAD